MWGTRLDDREESERRVGQRRPVRIAVGGESVGRRGCPTVRLGRGSVSAESGGTTRQSAVRVCGPRLRPQRWFFCWSSLLGVLDLFLYRQCLVSPGGNLRPPEALFVTLSTLRFLYPVLRRGEYSRPSYGYWSPKTRNRHTPFSSYLKPQ